MNDKPVVLYVTGRIYRPLEVMLRQFVSGLAQAGRPVRVEATQEHVPMLLEAYAAHGRLDRVALYVPALRNRSLATGFHNYGLPSDASWQAVEAAILRKGEHVGFGHAMIAVQEAATEVIEAEKRAYRNGADAATLTDW